MVAKVKKPKNIIVIVSDDQGYWSLGCSENSEIQTPSLDALAKNGVRFENFFCVSPVCSPARASLFTGKIPSQHGIHDWLDLSTAQRANIEYLKNQATYVDLLAAHGLVCGLSGKWHLGKSMTPQKGFSHWYAHASGSGPYYNAPMYRNGQLVLEKGYITESITEDAIQFINRHAAEPFYLHIGYTAPHSPWLNNHPEKYTKLYENCPFDSLPSLDSPNPASIYLTKEVNKNLKANQIGYYAAITAMDENIGKIMATVESLHLQEETLIVFTSDNGFSCGQHGFWGKGNGTFPLNLFDTTTKVPFIISYPGVFPTDAIQNKLVSAYDFRPTLLDIMGLEDPEADQLPGKSFLSAILNEEGDEQMPIVVMDEYGPNRMIRTARYKYIKRYPYGPNEFYDLLKDPGELENVIGQSRYQEPVNKMSADLAEWFLKYVDPRIDGAKENVYGSGQKGLAGILAQGENPYVLDDYIRQAKNFCGK